VDAPMGGFCGYGLTSRTRCLPPRRARCERLWDFEWIFAPAPTPAIPSRADAAGEYSRHPQLVLALDIVINTTAAHA